MNESAGKKKPRRGAKGRGGGRGLPEREESQERCPETTPRAQPALPATPHRAFDTFNDSVDTVNIDDLRDMQPGEYSVLYSGGVSRGIAELASDEVLPVGEGRAATASAAQGATPLEGSNTTEETGGNPLAEKRNGHDGTVVDEAELVRELDACEASAQQEEPLLGEGAEGEAGDDRLSADKYFYGPTQFSNRRQRGLLSSLRYCSRPATGAGASAGGESCADRSSVEVAEALLLGVLAEWGSGSGQRASDEVNKVPRGASAAGEASVAVQGGLTGVLGYVLHTLIALYYRLFVHIPLLVLHWLASHLWSATTSIVALAYVIASACLSAALWACSLPFRTAQRVLAWLWQHLLVLAVDFLNQAPPGFGGDAQHGQAPHKQAVPTALNGHVHKR